MTQPLPELIRGKQYTAPGIVVSYDTPRCIHAAECVRGLPEVFDTSKRPWIQPQNADALQVAEVVRRCPSGALHYLLAGETAEQHPDSQEQPQTPTTITPYPDGPLGIRGDLRIQTPDGEQHEVRATLCRCGQSSHKPYCDGTHGKVGWKSGPAPSDQQQS
ncbi:(4Fe-4S)-binding protein [Deinococcus sp. KNUC1210]|uniref:(4Fe-4S)-binding protein n=1 Tax=Deinococcus sp. KNUC1210 TaxID=2917691 RepID=UPI001EF10D6B|nr:(4Fe-4S)-binding protein [Deinococcus sp. KNUC1210]ULH14836.1 (4Fe-4S)-binding protein [Deinococcus sp. KNUC1210]